MILHRLTLTPLASSVQSRPSSLKNNLFVVFLVVGKVVIGFLWGRYLGGWQKMVVLFKFSQTCWPCYTLKVPSLTLPLWLQCVSAEEMILINLFTFTSLLGWGGVGVGGSVCSKWRPGFKCADVSFRKSLMSLKKCCQGCAGEGSATLISYNQRILSLKSCSETRVCILFLTVLSCCWTLIIIEHLNPVGFFNSKNSRAIPLSFPCGAIPLSLIH